VFFQQFAVASQESWNAVLVGLLKHLSAQPGRSEVRLPVSIGQELADNVRKILAGIADAAVAR